MILDVFKIIKMRSKKQPKIYVFKGGEDYNNGAFDVVITTNIPIRRNKTSFIKTN